MKEIKSEHAGIEITYNESTDRWVFELRGREKSAESLRLAREAIDKPEPKDKKPFTRIEAFKKDYQRGFTKVTVTSIAESGYGGRNVWILQNKNRSKESAFTIFPVNEHNVNLIRQWESLSVEIKALESKRAEIERNLKPIEVEAE